LTQQSEILERAFQSERYITKTQRVQLAQQLDLPENTIKVWFQNRRMKERRKSMMLPSNIVNNPWARERLMEYANELCQMREYRNYAEIPETSSSSSTQPSCDVSTFTANSTFSVESFYSPDFKPTDN
uniref:Homeobox domain-containing protein n=1 Tax=Rodentolepis nana TaxID=102285 RepID=A0A0R3TN01_RODNA